MPQSGDMGESARRGVSVGRARHVRAAPGAIFALLQDTASLADLLPRVSRIDVLARGADTARVLTHMALGPFGAVRSEGEVRWEADREIVFCAREPVFVEVRWALAPDGDGTLLRAAMTLDLAPLLGPFAALIPPGSIAAMIDPDLDAALDAIARKVEPPVPKERAIGR